jgi:lysophospholipase L1-like esterase
MNLIRKCLKIIFLITFIAFITYIIFCLLFQVFIFNQGFGIKSKKIDNLLKNYPYNTWVQFDKECSKYDSELFYTMKPGNCNFTSAEFSIKHKNNSYGLRDENEDLNKVEIITLGDSFTLGYGVQQEETFASLIEDNVKKETLNAGMSSYGTARESIILNRLLKTNKLSNLKYIVLQYCNNDYLENDNYVKNDYNLEVGPEFSEKKYELDKVLLMEHAISPVHKMAYNDISNAINSLGATNSLKRIFYGNIIVILRQLQIITDEKKSVFETGLPGWNTEDRVYKDFLKILQKIIKNPLLGKDVKIILFDVEPFMQHDPFYSKIKKMLENKQYSEIKKRVILVDIPSILDGNKDYFLIDGHTNRSGNIKIANKISQVIKNN